MANILFFITMTAGYYFALAYGAYKISIGLMSFGTLTGTASNGMILMKEVDPGLRTPVSSLYILSNFPAMVMIAPLLFMLGFAGQSFTNAIITFAVFLVLWLVYTIFIFRRRIFKKRFADKPVEEWKDEE